MKKTLFITFAFAGLLTFTACNDNAEDARQKAIADSLRNDSIMKAEAAANATNSDAGSATMEDGHDSGTSHSGSTGSHSGSTGTTTTTDNSGTTTTESGNGGKDDIKNGEGTGKDDIKNNTTTGGGKNQIKGK